MSQPVSAHLTVALCLMAGLAAGAARGEVRFQSRADYDLGSGATAFTFVDPAGGLLLVANANGLTAFRREDGGLVRGSRSPVGRSAQVLVAGPLGPGGALHVAYANRDAARITVAPIDAQGVVGDGEEIALPAAPHAAQVATLGPGGSAGLVVATDEGLSVLTRGVSGWQRHDVAAPRLAANFTVGDITGDGVADLVMADDSFNQLQLCRGTGDGGFEPASKLASLRGPQRLLLADTSGDGRADILVLGDAGLARHVAQASGGFGVPQLLWSSPHVADVGLGDLTGDGRTDLLVVDRNRAVLTVLIASADGGFGTGDSYLVGPGPTAVQLGDVDGDGRLDALTFNQLADTATLLRGRGDGRFDGIAALVGDLGEPTAIAVDDFDRDDHLDLAVASEDSGRVGLFLGRGDGRFRPAPPIAVGRQPRALVTGDFNQDEVPDLAVVNFGNDAVAILDGDGRGGFAAPRIVHVGVGPSAISIGSFASDTSTDLAVVNSLSDSVSVLYGDGRGQFPRVANFPVAARPSFLMVGDTNRDGHQDLVVGGEFSASVAILLGTGRQLDAPTTNTLSATARPSLAEDFDRDGVMDLANPDAAGAVVEILPGNAPGQFGLPLRLTVGRDPRALAAGDFDHDGRVDLAVVHRAAQTIAILLNQSPKPTAVERKSQRAGSTSAPRRS